MTLDEWLTQNGISETKFASRIGRTQATVNRIRRGIKAPSASVARAIRRETGGAVTPNDLFDGPPSPVAKARAA